MHWFVNHLIYLGLTKPTMQQRFHPSAKHCFTSISHLVLLGILFVLKVKLGIFCQFTVVHLDFISNIFSRRYASIGVATGGQRGHASPPIFRKYSDFVL